MSRYPRVDRAKARPVRGWKERMAREAAQQEQRLEEMRSRVAPAVPPVVRMDFLDPAALSDGSGVFDADDYAPKEG